MSRDVTVTVGDEAYDFIQGLADARGQDVAAAARELVGRGRVMLAVEAYRDDLVSLGRGAEMAGVPLEHFAGLLAHFGVKSRVGKAEYVEGLEALRERW